MTSVIHALIDSGAQNHEIHTMCVELFATKHWHVLQILSSYTRAMGRFSDVAWYDLIGGLNLLRVETLFD